MKFLISPLLQIWLLVGLVIVARIDAEKTSNQEDASELQMNNDGHDATKLEDLLIDWEGLERNAAGVEPSPVEGRGADNIILEHCK